MKYEIKDIRGYDISAIAKFIKEFGFNQSDIKRLVDTWTRLNAEMPKTTADVYKYLKNHYSEEEAEQLREKFGNDPEEISRYLQSNRIGDQSELISEIVMKIILGLADNMDAVFELVNHFYPDVDENVFINEMEPSDYIAIIKDLMSQEGFKGFLSFI